MNASLVRVRRSDEREERLLLVCTEEDLGNARRLGVKWDSTAI